MTPQQSDFSGGMNLRDAPDLLAENEYVWSVNVRTREKQLVSIKAPVEDTGLPDGAKQGLYAFGNYLLLFSGGRAFWKLITAATPVWTPIADFQMSTTASTFYVALVTGSSANFRRYRLDTSTNVGYVTDSGTGLATSNGTPAGLLVQDGVNQPWIIFADLTARVTQTYAQWTLGSAQEYVPIGTQMIVVGVKLFILALDGATIYQSISGRMLDFVVNVKTDGSKGGDASTTSTGFTGETVRALKATSLSTFAVATSRTSILVELDFDNKRWGEPTFKASPLAEIGAINERSVIEILGDYMLIDESGIHSVNAVVNLKFRGENAPFSSKVSKLFTNRLQSTLDVSAATFDNYAIFSVNTTMGYGLLIYDTILNQWVSLDQHDCVRVTHFAVTNAAGTITFWALTYTGKVFQLEAASAAYSQAIMMTRTFSDSSLKIDQQPKTLVLQIEDSAAGLLRVTPYCDKRVYPAKSRAIPDSTPGILWPMLFPISFSSTDRIFKVGIPLINLPYSRQFQAAISWTGGGTLAGLLNDDQVDSSVVDQKQSASYASTTNNP